MKPVPSNRRVLAGMQRQQGAMIVETALLFLTVLGMLIFIMDMGRILLMQEFITERARQTARAAAVNNWTTAQVQNYLVYGSATAPAGGGPGLLGLLTSQVAYSRLGTSGTSTYRLQVKVTGVPAFVFIPHIAGTYTLPPITVTAPAQSLGATT